MDSNQTLPGSAGGGGAFPVLRVERAGMCITNDPASLDLTAIHAYLTRSYWATGIALDVVEQSVRNSLCFGLFGTEGQQIGCARFVTDYATFAYLCDVYVLEAYRGQGLGKWLMEVVLTYPPLLGMRRILLATRDAHGLYAQYGFEPHPRPENLMQIHRPDVYRVDR
ncbi:MAG: GNAT family N-acetyltransferase [Candidatus Eisenbacteria bacterium]